MPYRDMSIPPGPCTCTGKPPDTSCSMKAARTHNKTHMAYVGKDLLKGLHSKEAGRGVTQQEAEEERLARPVVDKRWPHMHKHIHTHTWSKLSLRL